jgi:hypothetical protein
MGQSITGVVHHPAVRRSGADAWPEGRTGARARFGTVVGMLLTMLVAAAVAGAYLLLIVRQLRTARAGGSPYRRLHRAERLAAAGLLTGDLDRAAYRAEMETLAALDNVGRPLVVPAAEH